MYWKKKTFSRFAAPVTSSCRSLGWVMWDLPPLSFWTCIFRHCCVTACISRQVTKVKLLPGCSPCHPAPGSERLVLPAGLHFLLSCCFLFFPVCSCLLCRALSAPPASTQTTNAVLFCTLAVWRPRAGFCKCCVFSSHGCNIIILQ